MMKTILVITNKDDIYVRMAWIFKLESFGYLLNTIKGLATKESAGE